MLVLFIGGYSYVQATTMSVLLLYLSENKLFSHKVGFRFYPYPQQGLRIASCFFLEVHLLDIVIRYCSHSPEYQLTTSPSIDYLMGFKVHPLFGQSHREIITLPIFHFQFFKNLCILTDTNIYIYKKTQTMGFFAVF